jgi:hypothetical protein
MDFSKYQLTQVVQFLGLWSRGSFDDVPNDHASDIQNLSFTDRKEVYTRIGTDISFASGRKVVRSKMATFNDQTLIMLTCDGNGNIYREDNGTVLLNVPNMIDFEILNVNNKVLIAPVLSAFSATNYIYIWTGPSAALRPMAGARPSIAGMTATENSTPGVVNAGAHCFSVAYATDTGFVTAPGVDANLTGSNNLEPIGPYACATSNGNDQIWVTQIPTGAGIPGVTGRWLLMTKSNMPEFFRVPNPDGSANPTLPDTTTTSMQVSISDLGLTISADPLFDLAEHVLSGVSSIGLTAYKNRVFIINGGTTSQANTVVAPDNICVSSPGTVESFDQAYGNIQVPSQHDGNFARCASELFGVLYIFKSVGIFSTQDNGQDPYLWPVMMVDGSVGCYPKGLASITGSQNSLGISSMIILGDREGLFMFNGNVIRPELTYKIKNFWNQIYDASQIRIAIDPFEEQMYVLLPISSTANVLLVADYAAGLDPQAIRWTIYKFPWNINDVTMANIQDVSDWLYLPRLGTNVGLMKLTGKKTTDYGSVAVDNYWRTGLLTSAPGTVSVFRYLRWRMKGAGTLNTYLYDENYGNQITAFPQTIGVGNRDQAIQINYVNEQMSVKFETTGNMQVSRFDVFSAIQYPSRPSV